MSPATLHLLDALALYGLYGALCLGIIAACICRVNLMTASHNKAGWTLMYTLMAAYAGGELLDVLRLQIWMSTHELLGLVAIALNLGLTHRHWRDGPPPVTCREWHK
jgi:hypothetical protein